MSETGSNIENAKDAVQIQLQAATLHASNIYAELYRNALMTVAQELARMRAENSSSIIITPADIEQAVAAMAAVNAWAPPAVERLVKSAWRYVQSTGYSVLHGDQDKEQEPAPARQEHASQPPFPFGAGLKAYPGSPAEQKMQVAQAESDTPVVKVNPVRTLQPEDPEPAAETVEQKD